MPNVYKMPLLYSLNSNSYKDFFDPELEKILSKYSFFVSKSVKQGCLNSEYICTILKQAGITVIWFRLLGPFHFISCIIRENIRYYIDNETKSGFGVVYLRIEGDIIDTDNKTMYFMWGKIKRQIVKKDTFAWTNAVAAKQAHCSKGDVKAIMRNLEKLGAIKCIQKGKSGSFTRRANLYRREV